MGVYLCLVFRLCHACKDGSFDPFMFVSLVLERDIIIGIDQSRRLLSSLRCSFVEQTASLLVSLITPKVSHIYCLMTIKYENVLSKPMKFIYSLCPMLDKYRNKTKQSLIRHAMSLKHRITSGKAKYNE